MPSLSVRSFAEMLDKPIYEQIRILHEQKYPSKEPQMFKIPYYGKSITAIRKFYKAENDFKILDEALKDIDSTAKPESKKLQNTRVIKAFSKNKVSQRKLIIKPSPKLNFTQGDVEIRLSFDLSADEKKETRMMFFNLRNAEITEEIAKKTLEISHFILNENKIPTSTKSLELIDLYSGKVYLLSKTRKRTIDLMKSNMKIITTLWPSI
jgi:hypothetical protein